MRFSSAGLSEPRQPPETVRALQQLIRSVQQRAQPLRQPLVNAAHRPPVREESHASLLMTLRPFGFVVSRIVTMDFYGKNDLSLGVFLERYCFR